MKKYILPSFFFFLSTFILALPVQAQITVNNSGQVGISTSPSSGYQLQVEYSGGGSSRTAIRGVSTESAITNIGVRGTALNGYTNYGVYGIASGSSVYNRGIYVSASGGSSNNYGIYATASGSNNLAGYFSGSVYTTGSYQGSDQRLKKNIESLREDGILSKLGQLDPKRYQYLNEEELRSQRLPSLNATERARFGLLAQEVEEVFPELVRDVVSVLGEETGEPLEDPEMITTKAINYQELSVLLLAAIQEMQVRIETLESAVQGR